MSNQNNDQDFINQVEEKISNNAFYNGGLTPAFNVRDLSTVDHHYCAIKNAAAHTEEPFAYMGVRAYSFFKSSNDNIYVVERYMGQLGRVFKVTNLFSGL